MVNLRKFIINSDYPMDMIIWSGGGALTSTSLMSDTLEIPHSLGYTPLVFGQFSLDSGATWLPIGLVDFYQNGVDIYAESTNKVVRVVFTSLRGTDTKTAVVRLWGLAPSDVNKANTPPLGVSRFKINTGYNYSKLVAAGKWEIVSGGRQPIYSHNLGYVPEVMTWIELDDGTVIDPSSQFADNTTYWPIQYTGIDDTQLYGYFSSATSGYSIYKYVHYRIYGDRNG